MSELDNRTLIIIALAAAAAAVALAAALAPPPVPVIIVRADPAAYEIAGLLEEARRITAEAAHDAG